VSCPVRIVIGPFSRREHIHNPALKYEPSRAKNDRVGQTVRSAYVDPGTLAAEAVDRCQDEFLLVNREGMEMCMRRGRKQRNRRSQVVTVAMWAVGASCIMFIWVFGT
jgi:hypothetical protein